MITWGKKREFADHTEWHPLNHHALEVGCVLLELLKVSLFRRRLAHALGVTDLVPQQMLRLAALAALHDAGKCNHGFQDGRASREWSTHGHVREIFKLLFDSTRYQEGFASLNLQDLDTWFTEAGISVGPATQEPPDPLLGWLWAVFCHHGRPLRGDTGNPGKPQELDQIAARVWDVTPERDPLDGLLHLADAVRRTFAGAFASVGEPMALTPAAQHLLTGLVTLADWIASDDKNFFPFAGDATLPSLEVLTNKAHSAVKALGLAPAQARQNLKFRSPDFKSVFGFPTPNPMQQAVAELSHLENQHVVILESETGSGKTEAALWHFLRLFAHGLVDGLYFALPTRAAAVQLHQRTLCAMRQAFGPDHPPVILAVPGYFRVDDADAIRLAPFATLWNDEADRLRYRGWAAEHPKRYLTAPIAVGTIDQVLLSALATSHAHMRATSLSRLLLVVDEVHASDTYMTTILREVVQRLRQLGGYAMLMSATLGGSARSLLLSDHARPRIPSFDEASRYPYPLLTHHQGDGKVATTNIPVTEQGKSVTVERLPLADLPLEVVKHAVLAARTGARVLVIRNTVTWAVTTQLTLEQHFGADSALFWRCQDILALHHARFAAEDRKALDAAIEAALGKEMVSHEGRVVVSTQTTEQSLDIDCDYLITDLCPMDVLLQRIGRLHRHKRNNRPIDFATPRVLVLEPEEGLAMGLTENGTCTRAFMKQGWGSVYPDLRVLQATSEALQATPTITIPSDNRRLVEAATHPDTLESLANRLGGCWTTHGNKVWGTHAAQSQQARLGLYNRDCWLHDCNFHGHDDARLVTRLGMNDRLVHFPDPAPMGPFQKTITALTIPGRFLPVDFAPDAGPENILQEAGGFSFTFGHHRFHYDRLGLRPATD
ncbi:MAG: CRISPR-associated helicase Cas3' [Magnetococcales bacterium]|nr:CRISPR-associated helicase Cas3' [Magnetococcales bacterium]